MIASQHNIKFNLHIFEFSHHYIKHNLRIYTIIILLKFLRILYFSDISIIFLIIINRYA